MNPRLLARRAREKARYTAIALREMARPLALPARTCPLHLTFVFHTEAVATESAFRKLLRFAEHFQRRTDERITLCVTTPLCPQTELDLAREGTSTQTYAQRLRDLAEFAEIGYHGHFYRRVGECGGHPYAGLPDRAMKIIRDAPWFGELVPMVGEHFDAERVDDQIRLETQWLAETVAPPRAYVAGWWFMKSEIVAALEKTGIAVDCSVRQRHKPTLTEAYLPGDRVPPRGEPFLLPPSDGIIEIQSGFYPIEHPRRTLQFLSPTLERAPDRPLFLVFPSHETQLLAYEYVYRALIGAILKGAPALRWTSLSKQLNLARAGMTDAREATERS